jgi:hypothetical protein
MVHVCRFVGAPAACALAMHHDAVWSGIGEAHDALIVDERSSLDEHIICDRPD